MDNIEEVAPSMSQGHEASSCSTDSSGSGKQEADKLRLHPSAESQGGSAGMHVLHLAVCAWVELSIMAD